MRNSPSVSVLRVFVFANIAVYSGVQSNVLKGDISFDGSLHQRQASNPCTEFNYFCGTQTGQVQFYSTGRDACGGTDTDSGHTAAVSHLLFDAFPGYNGVDPTTNGVCGTQIRVTFQGKSTVVTATDRCEGCALADLDLSPAAYQDLESDLGAGRITVTWVWV
ncbi:hypothetical protein VKT23_016871 [Stygiomarasmius scandens]|uniref:RlpA-like protein double-psi beta-barrel domain-containing protein n=1 Tax=Marasmiellus scandens TaxID=2682957 RepID=A0ABR1ITV9_9AGAR